MDISIRSSDGTIFTLPKKDWEEVVKQDYYEVWEFFNHTLDVVDIQRVLESI